MEGAGFGTPEHAIKSLFSCFKNRSDFKYNGFNSPEITLVLRMAPFELTCEISDVSSEKLCYNACFCEAHRRKNRVKIVVPKVVETRDTIKFCVKLEYKPTEKFSLLQRGEGC